MTKIKQEPIIPGPCEGECPEPTEIVCIQTTKVYDFCFQTDTIENACFTIPAACTPPVAPTVEVACTITNITTTVVARVPLPPPAPPGFARVTIRLVITETFTLTDTATGVVVCTFTADFPFVKTIGLCAPVGTDVTVTAAGSRCGPCFILGGTQVCCEIDLCLLIQSTALVNLLVPAYGFCTPAECVELPKTALVCPPSPLFPPQCEVTGTID